MVLHLYVIALIFGNLYGWGDQLKYDNLNHVLMNAAFEFFFEKIPSSTAQYKLSNNVR